MTNLIFVVLILCTTRGVGFCCEISEFDSLIHRLGSSREVPATTSDLECLAAHPRDAARRLVADLHEVSETAIALVDQPKHPAAMHVIWCLRALSYITGGLRFSSKTSHAVSKRERDREYFLTDNGQSTALPFFAVWMSRDAIFIAPKDVQRSVIRQWQDWGRLKADTFSYSPAARLDDWYF